MKAPSPLQVLPLLVLTLLGGCLEPIPYDRPTGYMPNQGRRYPPPNYGPNPGPRTLPAPPQRQVAPRPVNPNRFPGEEDMWPNSQDRDVPDNWRERPDSTLGTTERTRPPERRPEDNVTIKRDIDPMEDKPVPVREEPKYLTGIKVQGKDNLIMSPYSQDRYIDVSNVPSGSKIKCPVTGKVFLVP